MRTDKTDTGSPAIAARATADSAICHYQELTHLKSPFIFFAGQAPKSRENLRLKAVVSLRKIPPLPGGEGWGEGGRNLFPTGTEIAFNQPFPKSWPGEILVTLGWET